MPKSKAKTIEERYKKKSQLEHILDRPDSYIGSIELTELDDPMWVINDIENTLVKKNLKIVPGLYKIFDEILVNASDQTIRDETCDIIKVNIIFPMILFLLQFI